MGVHALELAVTWTHAEDSAHANIAQVVVAERRQNTDDLRDAIEKALDERFEAGRASRDGEVEALKSELATERTFSKECLEEKDRECHYRLKFSAQLAEKDAELRDLERDLANERINHESCIGLLHETQRRLTEKESAFAVDAEATKRMCEVLDRQDAPASKGEGDG